MTKDLTRKKGFPGRKKPCSRSTSGDGPRFVGRVDVHVGSAVVDVLVQVEAAAPQVPEHLDPESDEHNPHAELEHRRYALVAVQDRVLEQQYHDPQQQQRGRMSQTPGPADPYAPPGVPVLADDGGHRHHVVGVGGVL